MKKLLLTGILLSLSGAANSAKIRNFSTDGCSAYPDGVLIHNPGAWVHCCITHDMAYWRGGTKEQRRQADHELSQCVGAVSSELHGEIMELGVFLGGAPGTPMPWRWGYGWSEGISYRELTEEEKTSVAKNFDSIFQELIDKKTWLLPWQKSYVLGRYELLRHETYSHLSPQEELENFDERVELVKKFLED